MIAFLGIALALTLTPGADTMLVVRSVLARGPREGVATALGICSGLFVHATASALGLSVFLMRSATAFEVVKTAGAAYLAYLGARSLYSAWKGGGGAFDAVEGESADVTSGGLAVAGIDGAQGPAVEHAADGWRLPAYRDGLVCNILNPKVAVFYLAFLPQFISPGDPVFATSMMLAAVHFTMGFVWLVVVSYGLGRIRPLLVKPRVRRGLEATTGALLVGFGLKLALSKR
jgi:threonine/homoserine/homoserine lactone efflux protein